MVKVFDNIATPSYAKAIEEDVSSFPWWYLNDVTYENSTENPGFVNVVYESGSQPSNWFPFIKPLIYQIADLAGAPMYKLLRARLGLLLPTREPAAPATPHVDFFQPHYTACYYLNNSDGDTVIYDQRLDNIGAPEINQELVQAYARNTQFTVAHRITPKQGSVCVFDGKHFHSSTNPYTSKKRLVLTINWM